MLAADAEHQAALATCAHVFAGAGRRDRAGAVLALLTGNATPAPDPYQVAVTHHALGRTRAAVASLEDALASRSANLCLLGVDLRAGRLPITPESLALLSRIGLRPDAFGLADP